MATPADQRLLDLVEKWLSSLELHLRYASLDDESYAKIQPWPPHQRPNRWVISLAKQRALALKAQIEERVKMGDVRFSEALEMMAFLANLVGGEHIERFIPAAEKEREQPVALAPPDMSSMSSTTNVAQVPGSATATATREMPKFLAAKPRTPPPAGTAHVARTERRAHARPALKLPNRAAAKLNAKSAFKAPTTGTERAVASAATTAAQAGASSRPG